MDNYQIEDIKNFIEEKKTGYKAESDIQAFNFSSYNAPIFKENFHEKWITCGADNLFPNYLIRILNNSAIHNAIIESKVKQIVGEGLTIEDSNDKIQLSEMKAFLNQIKFNQKTLKRISFDQQLFGYWFLGITWSNDRTKIANIYHVDASCVRVGVPNKDTKMVDHFFYSDDWSQTRKNVFKPEKIEAFNPNRRIEPNCLLMIRGYRPATRFYNLPPYEGCRDSIELDAELSCYLLNSIKNGLSPSMNISFNSGKPTEEEREVIYRTINALYKGANNAGKFILSFNDSKENATTVEPIQMGNMSEIYSSLGQQSQNRIVIGHRLTSPILAGISIPGQLGGSASELERAAEAFFNYVIAPSQMEIEEVIQELLAVNNWDLKVWIKDSQPISYQYEDSTLMTCMTIDELRSRINLPALSDFDKKNLAINISNPINLTVTNPNGVTNSATINPNQMDAEQMNVNDNIKNLSAKQYQQLMRIIREFSKEKLTRAGAMTLLKTGLGLTDKECAQLLAEEEMDLETPGIPPYVDQVKKEIK